MEITARVSTILPLASGTSSSGNPWQRATVVVEWQDGQYTKKLALSNMKKAEEFMNLFIGQEYTFKFDVTSREYNGKWYHDVNCFAWQPTAQMQPQQAAAAPVQQQPFQQPPQGAYGNPYGAQPPYPQQPGAPAPQPYQPAPAYNPAQPQYAQPMPQADDNAVPF